MILIDTNVLLRSAQPAHSHFTAGLQLHRERQDKDWSLTDCISFIVTRRREIQHALTYDHHFVQAGFEALLRRDPT
jgi:predicted nucleic acid-binding protein